MGPRDQGSWHRSAGLMLAPDEGAMCDQAGCRSIIADHLPTAAGGFRPADQMEGSRITPTRDKRGASSFSSSSHFPLMPYS